MNIKEYKVLNRYDKVKVLAKITTPKVLTWKDEYKKDSPPSTFVPIVNEYGVYIYTVPYAYAERLFKGEPYKYYLIAPESIHILAPTKNGGNELKDIQRVLPYVIDGVIQRDGKGFPRYLEKLPSNADDIKPIVKRGPKPKAAALPPKTPTR